MPTKQRLLALAAALSISLTACEGSLPMGPTSGPETGEAGPSLAALIHTDVVIDFEDIISDPHPQNPSVTVLSTYSEDGFTISNSTMSEDGFKSPEDESNSAWVGSRTLINAALGGVTLLTKVGGGAFDVESIEIAEVPLEIVWYDSCFFRRGYIHRDQSRCVPWGGDTQI